MNNTNIIGTLTGNPELKYTDSGTAVCKFNIAWNEKIKNQQGGYDDKAHFFEVVAWGKTGENVQKHFHKGKQIGITGSLNFSQWKDQQSGQNRSRVNIKMDKFYFIGSKSDNYPSNEQDNYNQPQQQMQQGGYQQPIQNNQNMQMGHGQQNLDNVPTIDIDNDEIPF